jgi:hypothetical protein
VTSPYPTVAKVMKLKQPGCERLCHGEQE